MKTDSHLNLRVAIVQPVVPSYRLGFFSRLADALGPQFFVYASALDMGELTNRDSLPVWEQPLGTVLRIFPGVDWQVGALSIPIRSGDIFVISGAPRCLSNIALLIKARLKGARTIWWGHYWSATSRPWRKALRIVLMRLSDAVIFYTDREVQEYLAEQGNRGKLVRSLNNGIETKDVDQLRTPYRSSARPRDLLFIGRLTEKAKLRLLIEALARPCCASVRLDVIGEGQAEADLRRLCDTLGIAERVTWHGGISDEARIAGIANDCKVFVYPGSVGLSLIHALAYGLPAIVHDNRWGHMPEIAALASGQNGMTFREGDAASLAQVVSSLLAAPERLNAMSAVAVATTVRSYNAADMAERFLATIEAVASMAPPAAQNRRAAS